MFYLLQVGAICQQLYGEIRNLIKIHLESVNKNM